MVGVQLDTLSKQIERLKSGTDMISGLKLSS